MNTANIGFSIFDESAQPDVNPNGIVGFSGIFERGPIGKGNEVFSSWERAKKVYGGINDIYPDTILINRLLKKGVKVRISKIAHLADIENINSWDGTLAAATATDVISFDTNPMGPYTQVKLDVNGTTVSYIGGDTNHLILSSFANKLKASFPNAILEARAFDKVLYITKKPGTTLANAVVTGWGSAATRASATLTITAIGADGDSISVNLVDTTNTLITTVTVVKTAAIGTTSQFAQAIADAINALNPTGAPDKNTATVLGSTVTVNTKLPFTATFALVASKTGTAAFTAPSNYAGGDLKLPIINSSTITGHRNASVGSEELFKLIPKGPGTGYDMIQSISPSSNGLAGYFNLTLRLLSSGEVENYTNLTIPGAPNVVDSSYLDDVKRSSAWVDVQYQDLSNIVGVITPVYNSVLLTGGVNGSTPNLVDWKGSNVSKTGLHAFDGEVDMYAIAGSNTSLDYLQAGSDYAMNRKDLQFYFHFTNNLNTATGVVNARKDTFINNPYLQMWAGGLKIKHPISGETVPISAIADILVASAKSESNPSFGPWWSFAGMQRGTITDVVGVVNNFLNTSDEDILNSDLNYLANHQINAVVNDGGQIYLSGNFSGQTTVSKLAFNNIVRCVIYVKKLTKGVIKLYLEQPNDIPTWKEIYMTEKDQMDPLVDSRRALFGWSWQGDQFAKELSDGELQVNNVNDVSLGKYKARLGITPINSLQEIQIDILVQNSVVSFEDVI